MDKKVVVGLSGGVDSAVAAYLLKEAGYEVIAVFMRNWDSELNNDYLGNNKDVGPCPQELDYQSAVEVAKQLDIPLHRVDFVKEYWEEVFLNFLEELKLGYTPNPDIWCNKWIKFGHLLEHALNKLGADLLATGHYARVEDDYLLRGTDKEKDQSYFLAQLSNKQLEKILFPLGKLTKKEVRGIAERIGLKNAKRPDSVGICFIGKRDFSKFLSNYLPEKKGPIIHETSGKKIGEHNGIFSLTIGQRKGIKIGGLKEAIFVTRKDVRKNIIYVAYRGEGASFNTNKLVADSFNLIRRPRNPKKLTIKIRYRSDDIPARIKFFADEPNKVEISYLAAAAVTPGQQVVIYEDEYCIGGAVIREVST